MRAQRLARRELECLDMLAQGHTKQEISFALQISLGTVKTHLAAAYRKLGATSATGAVWEGLRIGLIDPPNPSDHCEGCICSRLKAARNG